MKTENSRPSLLVLHGPTASGKSAMAEYLAEKYSLPIISADSRQIYRHFNIGTAKPSPDIQERIQYEMIDIIEPTESFSAGKFARQTRDLIEIKYAGHPVVIICGGTEFYLSALFEGLAKIPSIPTETDLKWNEIFEKEGLEYLKDCVKDTDPLYFVKGELDNPHRLLRALKVKEASGKSILEYRPEPILRHSHLRYDLVLRQDRSNLYDRIDQRVDNMIRDGLIEEAESLLQFRNSPAMRTVGYRELLPYFDGDITRESAIDKIKQHSRNYAKRQLTWLRRYDSYPLVSPEDQSLASQWIETQLQ